MVGALAPGHMARSVEAAACADPNTNLPADLAGWAKQPAPMATAHDVREARDASIALRTADRVHARQHRQVKFAISPSEQMPKQYIYSGMAAFQVPNDGTYAVMIGEANWIDVIQNDQPIRSLQMRGRIPCVKYGKMVEFPRKKRRGDCPVLRRALRNGRRLDRGDITAE